tara:strand:- start:568 stop:795 length:228 start_codon:yes stop_codon:yes gene_type:complete
MEKIFISSTQIGNWIPSYGFLYFVLLIGALLTAGVALSAFSFYEDFYWGDKNFREQLRFHPSQRREIESNRNTIS